jgi:hypothetical protein
MLSNYNNLVNILLVKENCVNTYEYDWHIILFYFIFSLFLGGQVKNWREKKTQWATCSSINEREITFWKFDTNPEQRYWSHE